MNLERMDATGTGYASRMGKKLANIERKDPDICGQFRIDIQDDNFDALFTSKANK